MKPFKVVIVAMYALFAFYSAKAQSNKSERTIGIKTQIIKVIGISPMCKTRIENTALTVDGIKSGNWDEGIHNLTIKYDLFKKDAVENTEKKLASLGHDNEKYQANNKVYNALPDCCHYRNG